MSKKTNLSIERTGTCRDFRGDWRVIGKLTGNVYYRGTRYDCAWAIGNHQEWYREEMESAEQDRLDKEACEYQQQQELLWRES